MNLMFLFPILLSLLLLFEVSLQTAFLDQFIQWKLDQNPHYIVFHCSDPNINTLNYISIEFLKLSTLDFVKYCDIPIPYNMTPKQKKPQRIQSRGKKHSSLIDHNFN